MVYLLLAFAGIYSLMWLLGLVLTIRSPDRNLAVPAIGLLGFLGLSGFAGMKTTEAMDNPHKLTAEKFSQLKAGMSPDEVKGLFGEPAPIDKKYNLATYHIGMPKGLNRSLSMDQRHVDRIEASIKVKISGEPSEANLRRGEGLGAPANLERGGLMGATLRLVENENETLITEGEHWTYEDNDTPEIVAKKIAEAIDATEAWAAVGSTDEEPNMVTITPELEANFGTACNDGACTVQVVAASEPEVAEGEESEEPADVTGAIIIRSKTDGEPQEFRGGSEEAYLWIWDEKGRVLDTDFSNVDRIVVVGFDKHAVVSSVQSGLGIEAPPAEAPAAGGEG